MAAATLIIAFFFFFSFPPSPFTFLGSSPLVTQSRGTKIMVSRTKPLDLMQAPHSSEKPASRHQTYPSGTTHTAIQPRPCLCVEHPPEDHPGTAIT